MKRNIARYFGMSIVSVVAKFRRLPCDISLPLSEISLLQSEISFPLSEISTKNRFRSTKNSQHSTKYRCHSLWPFNLSHVEVRLQLNSLEIKEVTYVIHRGQNSKVWREWTATRDYWNVFTRKCWEICGDFCLLSRRLYCFSFSEFSNENSLYKETFKITFIV